MSTSLFQEKVLSAIQEFAAKLQNDTGAEGLIVVDVPQRIYDEAHAETVRLCAYLDPPDERRYGQPIVYRASPRLDVKLTSKEIENRLRAVVRRAEEATRAPGSEWGELEL